MDIVWGGENMTLIEWCIVIAAIAAIVLTFIKVMGGKE